MRDEPRVIQEQLLGCVRDTAVQQPTALVADHLPKSTECFAAQELDIQEDEAVDVALCARSTQDNGAEDRARQHGSGAGACWSLTSESERIFLRLPIPIGTSMHSLSITTGVRSVRCRAERSGRYSKTD